MEEEYIDRLGRDFYQHGSEKLLSSQVLDPPGNQKYLK